MFKVLVVGCGGSGAKSLSYMMDQLKTTLAENAPVWFERNDHKLPDAWQFVSIDVPTQPEKVKAIPNVPDAGGQYISTGASSNYSFVDRAVSVQLSRNNALGSIATWAYPKPDEVTVPVDAGAGQFRGVGRMLILNKLTEVEAQLKQAKDRLYSAQAASQLDAIRSEMGQGTPTGEQAADPIVFVVSSMAGGAGASMALDVCRLLSGLGLNNYQGRSALFMVTPDVFKAAGSADSFVGTSPNALAMFGELAAGQFGEGAKSDSLLYNALGYQGNLDDTLVSRVFPVGISAGVNAVPIADGAGPSTVYRALGRGLAALTTDTGMMGNFVAYQLGNTGSLPYDRDFYGWGLGDARSNAVPWGTFGYGRLAMGRDRYGEYAAQRLASSAVNTLKNGFKFTDSVDSDDDQLDQRLEKSWQNIQRRLANTLPLPADERQTAANAAETDQTWASNRFSDTAVSWAQSRVDMMKSSNVVPAPESRKGAEWANDVEASLSSAYRNRQLVADDVQGVTNGSGPLYRAVYQWAGADELQREVLEVLSEEIGRYGVAFGSKLLKTIRQHVSEAAARLRQTQPAEGLFLDGQLGAEIRGQRGKIVGDGYLDRIYGGVRDQFWYIAMGNMMRLAGNVLEDFARYFLADFDSEIQAAHRELNHDLTLDNDPSLGVAQTKTNVPRLWPSEEVDVVPDRFSNAANEVMITEPKHYPGQFEEDVIQSVITDENRQLRFDEALVEAAQQIVAGDWRSDADADDAPRDLLTLVQPWVPRALTSVPDSADLRNETNGKVELKIRSEHVLDRSRKFVGRAGFSFSRFIETSLRSYILDAPDEPTRADRREDLAGKFAQAMTKALPLAQINSNLLHAMYKDAANVKYKFNFSTVPFAGDSEMADRLGRVERDYPNADFDPNNPLGGALQTNGEQREISIYGSYPNYLPVVFDSILPSAARQWDKLTLPNARTDFWQMRRARPINAATPLTDAERQAMINGWYVGRLIGTTIFPGDKNRATGQDSIHVFDPVTQSWEKFDTPLLTPPSKMRTNYDWLPAILESLPMAWAKADESPALSSLNPYRALRRNWDATEGAPATARNATRGYDLLRKWLFDGVRIGAEQTKHTLVKGTGTEASPEERRDAAIAWLQDEGKRALQLVPTPLLPSTTPPGGPQRELADISDRNLAMQVPLLIDIANGVLKMAEELIGAIREAYEAGPPEQDFASGETGLDFLDSKNTGGSSSANGQINDIFGGF